MKGESKLGRATFYRGVLLKNICLDFHTDVYLRISYDEGLELISTTSSRLRPDYIIGVDMI